MTRRAEGLAASKTMRYVLNDGDAINVGAFVNEDCCCDRWLESVGAREQLPL